MWETNMTRAEYLERSGGNENERIIAHREYYAQFVDDSIRAMVTRRPGLSRLVGSRDRSFDDIDIKLWEGFVLGEKVHTLLKERGDYMTANSKVCILKEAARQVVDGASC
jgi:hypothetical protein